jgi:hypothetical protein
LYGDDSKLIPLQGDHIASFKPLLVQSYTIFLLSSVLGTAKKGVSNLTGPSTKYHGQHSFCSFYVMASLKAASFSAS